MNRPTHPGVHANLRAALDLLVCDAWRLKPEASQALREVHHQAVTGGIDSLTPAELAWIASLVAETRERAFREQLMAAAGANL